MDRRRAAAALLALTACFACSAAAPTADHTALDVYDGSPQGCYYNFQHYGEGDRIMTNEPCLNCTCHNRMLMCYLRVCPFTKPIGQDCTVEKRADQCCPIVTCPDIPVDLLTSTSTTSPAEYGGTGVGKVDNYGCTINGKYLSEGAKVPQTPNKPCEHCYCIRNMTTCVMQECTLHVDGCTPIYHRDVCCPVRYSCDHPEDEIPLLDDMTTTVRPTPGFLLTTTTDVPVTQTQTRRECIENDNIYPDGSLIKSEKPCVHCYCMKGDIVCVVQECGIPMENEGKNCTSQAPREGQCCPDTYICEGDELATELPSEELVTLQPPRRVSVEGSGYRNEPDKIFTEIPISASEIEGSGEEPELAHSTDSNELFVVEKETTKGVIDEMLITTDEVQYSPFTTSAPTVEHERFTTEPDERQNDVDDESSEPSIQDKTTSKAESDITVPTLVSEKDDSTTGSPVVESSEPVILDETTIRSETKATDQPLISEQTSVEISEDETSEPFIQEVTTLKQEEKETATSATDEQSTVSTDIAEDKSSEPSIFKLTTLLDEIQSTEKAISEAAEQESSEPSIVDKTTPRYEFTTESKQETVSEIITESDSYEVTKASPEYETKVTEPTDAAGENTVPSRVAEDESLQSESTTPGIEFETKRPIISDESTIPEEESSQPSLFDKTTTKYDTRPEITSEHTTIPSVGAEESSETSTYEKTTTKGEIETTVAPSDDKQTIVQEDDHVTTETLLNQEDDIRAPIGPSTEKEVEPLSTTLDGLENELTVPSENVESSGVETTDSSLEEKLKPTTTQITEQVFEEISTEYTTELEESRFTKPPAETTSATPETEIMLTTSPSEKQDLPITTTINPEDNEISEELLPIPPPGRIPGEGDCLINGITYTNDSSIPSTNKCHTSCKCISSIVKCDPIICSPQPEYMDNCQPIYDTPDSCCPTFVCDHSRETIPPQSHSQMSGTESPLPSSAIECHGDECEVIEEKLPTTLSYDKSEFDQKPEISECGPEGCEENKKPTLPQPPKEESEEPTEKIPQSCANPEDCEKINIPDVSVPLCEGAACTTMQVSPDAPCDGENCEKKPENKPDQVIPQTCENEDDCKITKVPETGEPLCEGDLCSPDAPCDEENCKTKPENKPDEVIPQSCENEDDCKITKVPETGELPCEGDLCKLCEGENCERESEIKPDKAVPQTCENEDDCKTTKVPETAQPPCEGDSCKVCEGENCERKPEIKPDEGIPQTCENEDCKVTKVPVAAQPPCEGDSCKLCEGENCEIKPEIKPDETTTQTCENEDDCKITTIPETSMPPCEGDSCKQCEGENCESKPEIKPDETTTQTCENEDDCKITTITETFMPPCEGDSCIPCNGENCEKKPEIKPDELIPQTTTPPCQGDLCKEIQEDCSTGICISPQPSPEKELCTEESGCKKPTEIEDCVGENCRRKEDDLEHVSPSECKDSECMPSPVSSSQETTTTVHLDTEISLTEQTPLESSGEPITEGENLPTKMPESFVTEDQEVLTDLPEFSTYVTDKTITSIPEKMETDKPYKSSEIPEPATTKTEEVSTETPKDATTKVPEIVSEHYVPEYPETEHSIAEASTQEPGIVTESPELHVTETKSQEEITVLSEEATTETQMFGTTPAVVVIDEIYQGIITKSEEQDVHTEIPDAMYTEPEATRPKDVSTMSPESVQKQEDVVTESLEPHVTISEERTEIPEVEEPEKLTESPEFMGTKYEKETDVAEIPQISTKSPDGVVTEVPTSAEVPEVEEEIQETTYTPLIKITQSSVTEPQEISTDKVPISKTPEEYVSKTQETITTETLAESTKAPYSFDTVSYEQGTELPEPHITTHESRTEIPSQDMTIPQELYTNVLLDDVEAYKTTIMPETITNEKEIVTSTQTSLEEEDKTKAPEIFEAASQGFGGSTTEQIPIEKEETPKLQLTTEQEMHPHVTEESILQQETEPTLPSIGPEDYGTNVPEVAITVEEKIHTESPMSLVTKLEETEVTTVRAPTSDYHESITALPELPTQESESTENTPISSEKPQSHTIQADKTVTEVTDQSITEHEVETKIPDQSYTEEEQIVPTETPSPIVTDMDESAVTDHKDMETERPTVVETETTHEEASSEIPITEKDFGVMITEKITETEEPSITQVPEQPGEIDIQTKLPVYITTENQELETNAPEVATLEDKYTIIPEIAAEITTPSLTKSQEMITEVPSMPEIKETSKIPEQDTTEEVSVGTSTESQKITTSQLIEEIDHIRETTDEPKTTRIDEGSETELPEAFTKGYESGTDLPELHKPVPEKETTRPSDMLITEHEEGPTTESFVSKVTKFDEINTNVPESLDTEQHMSTEPIESAVTEQEHETKAPVTLPQQYAIQTEVTSPSATTAPVIDLSQTESPALQLQELDTSSPIYVTRQEEAGTTEASELEVRPTTVYDSKQEEKYTEPPLSLVTQPEELSTKQPEPAITEQQEFGEKSPKPTEIISVDSTEATKTPGIEQANDITELSKKPEYTTEAGQEYSETTPYLVELEEHPHKVDGEQSTIIPLEEHTTVRAEAHEIEHEQEVAEVPTENVAGVEIQTEMPLMETEKPYDEKQETSSPVEELSHPEVSQTTLTPPQDVAEITSEPAIFLEQASPEPLETVPPESQTQKDQDKETTPTSIKSSEEDMVTSAIPIETEKPLVSEEVTMQTEKDFVPITGKPLEMESPLETTAPEEEFIPAKSTTTKIEEEMATQAPELNDKFGKPEEKPIETLSPTPVSETPKPGFNELQPTDEVPSPEEDGQFPPSGGYGQEPDYVEEDQAFGPGTCRYGGKVYVSAQQIPRDDPCDFCFCFRSDIICLQQSCPPPIHGCHEEPIQGFCCPRYECPVSMALTLNVTTTTTTTTTTLPPHFLPHAYKGAAQRRGCQIKGHTYKVGEVVRASSGPCLHCTCGADGQMKCDPKVCTPEPMLRQMIAAAVSAKRRR